MGGSRGFSSGYDHLVEWVTLVKVRVEILTKLTRPAGAGIKAADYSAIDVFHGEAPEGRKHCRPVCVAVAPNGKKEIQPNWAFNLWRCLCTIRDDSVQAI
jgi:hypothetical protein